jgi:hypothetical protein
VDNGGDVGVGSSTSMRTGEGFLRNNTLS